MQQQLEKMTTNDDRITVSALEETFDLQIPDQDLVGLTTVGHVVSYVEKRLGKTASPPPAMKPAKPSKSKNKKKS